MKNIRVLVIDDSAYNRRTITKMLQEMSGVEVVGYAVNGEEGLKRIIELRPDLVTLDLEMPRMDGFTMLRIMMASCPTPTIVISAKNEDERVFKALELGAADFIAKPTSTISEEIVKIKKDLFAKVRNVSELNLGGLKRREATTATSSEIVRELILDMPAAPVSRTTFELLAIGSSTGGPPALQTVLASFPEEIPFGVVVSQHMPAGFTRAFAERLNRSLPFEVKEAKDGDLVTPNLVLIAPGGMNMIFQQISSGVVARIVKPAASDKYIPSVNEMFRSLARLYGPRLLAAVLTGMGNDGSKGVREISAAGGIIVAESEDSAVIFGMPREAIATGMVSSIVPIELMAREILLQCGILK